MMLQELKIRMLALDLKGCIYLNRFSKVKLVARFFKVVSRLGDGTFWYAMMLTTWLMHKNSYYRQIIYLMIASSCATLLYKLLKHKTTRPRPYQVHQVIVLGERPLDHFSFPSGHTLHAVLSTIVLGYIQPVLLVIMIPFALCVALSRMVLGLHYPSDVLVGAILGATMAALVINLSFCFNILL
ncbi:phosphatase PAP2 family protein [Acinetobacter nectaris]|uniref:phosphatase PAP2 family protein n=1 Tax=Acinetobacter nectaris TaxID=1219382 RepID=UPI001F1B6718|nr:phosphatase PAP2 family protein [Acinetobacter nectaris]MCF9034963.1 phosphatase PAP2 family protein [Acinetobacter nectaris]